MLYSIEGKVTHIGDRFVVLETAGIGFKVNVLDSFLGSVEVGTSARVVCFMQQDPLTLYGFASQEELSFFELLNTISGIGPKIAAKIMNAVPVRRLSAYVALEQKDQLASQAGISTKTASKIILDLKEKIQKSSGKEALMESGLVELESILSDLGYKQKDIESVRSQIPAELTIEEKVRRALKLLSTKRHGQ